MVKHWLTPAPLTAQGVDGAGWVNLESPSLCWQETLIPASAVWRELPWLAEPLYAHLAHCPLPLHGCVLEPRVLTRLWRRAALTRTHVTLCQTVQGNTRLPRGKDERYVLLETPLLDLAGLCWRYPLPRWAVTLAAVPYPPALSRHAQAARAAVIGELEAMLDGAI